jgi:hypothetical protein
LASTITSAQRRNEAASASDANWSPNEAARDDTAVGTGGNGGVGFEALFRTSDRSPQTDGGRVIRQLAFQIADVVSALLRVPQSQDIEELKTIAIFCGAGFDASLVCFLNGWI